MDPIYEKLCSSGFRFLGGLSDWNLIWEIGYVAYYRMYISLLSHNGIYKIFCIEFCDME